MRIDIHTHILPKHFPNWSKLFSNNQYIYLDHHKPCCARMMQGDTFFREIEHNCWDADIRKNECEQHGITQQVLSTIPVMFHYWAKPNEVIDTSRFLNDHIAEVCNTHKDSFFGLGTLPMQDVVASIIELERCINDLHLQGVQIGSHVNDTTLSDPRYHALFAKAEELGACIFVHPWDMMGKQLLKKYWLEWLVGMPAETSLAICSFIFGGLFEKFPKLRVAFAHGGGSFPATFGRIAHGYEARPDLVAIDNAVHPSNYLGKFWLDTLVHDADMLNFIAKLIGTEKLCIGSDYPFPLGELEPGKLVNESNFSKEIKDQINYKNALTWLGVSF